MNSIKVYSVAGVTGTLAVLQKWMYLPWPAA